VSPDGRHVAFTGSDGIRSRLYIRSLSAFEATAVDGADGARQPFWSADSQWVGFFGGGRVLKVSRAGGAPVTIADDREAGVGTRRTEMGGTWGRDGLIVYGANFNPPALVMVPAAGGAPAPATRLVAGRGDNQHRFPSFLPDGRHFLYWVRGSKPEGRGVFVGSVDDVESDGVRVLPVNSNAVYAPTAGTDSGVVLYVANERIEAQRFDAFRHRPVGSPQPLGIEAGGDTLFSPAAIGASSDVLAYSTRLGSGYPIRVAGADGSGTTVLHDRQEQLWPRISPDGTRMARLVIDPTEPNADIWVEDLDRRTRTRVTTAPSRDLGHVWSPDGRRLAYRPDVDDRTRLSIIAADGSGVAQDLVCPAAFCEPTDWSSDGRELIVNAYERGGTDVWAVALAAAATSRPLVQTPFNERDARLSPNRRWIAYVSDEAGRPEVSVRNLDGSPRRYMASPGGGDQVVWQRDGRALYYVDPQGRLRRVAVRDVDGELSLGNPVDLPVTIGSGHSNTQYDVAPDGRIYYLDPTPPPLPTEIRIVLGWQRLLN
jgi:Tol biopolymer transport system component